MFIEKHNEIILTKKSKKTCFIDCKKSELFKELKNSLNFSNLDKSIYWSIIIDLSDFYKELIYFLIYYYLERINISNPHFIKIFINIFKYYNNIINNNVKSYNSQILRNHLSLLITNISLSSKTDLPKIIKFPKKKNINILEFKNKIYRHDTKIISELLTIQDNKCIIIPLNEIDYALSNKDNDTSNLLNHAIFWLSWIMETEDRSDTVLCSKRKIRDINEKYNSDVSWLIWKIIFNNSRLEIQPILNNLFVLYKLDYNKTNKKKRHIFFIYSFLIIINKIPKINFNIPLITSIKETLLMNLNINLNYNQISDIKINPINNNMSKKKKQILFIPIIK